MVPTAPQVVSAWCRRCYHGDTMARTTTLKLSERLRRRIAPLAKASNMTPHAWMLEALDTQAALAERRSEFVGSAMSSIADDLPTYAADDVHAYFIASASRKPVPRPKPRPRRVAR